jgi:hypothetical protein
MSCAGALQLWASAKRSGANDLAKKLRTQEEPASSVFNVITCIPTSPALILLEK